MRKYTENLMNSLNQGRTDVKVGNHRAFRKDDKIFFTFHGNAIMVLNFKDNTITVNDCGYHTTSTTQAINSHIEGIFEILWVNHKGMKKIDLSYKERFTKKLSLLD